MKERLKHYLHRIRERYTDLQRKVSKWGREKKATPLKEPEKEIKEPHHTVSKFPWRDWISVAAQVGTMIAAIVAIFALRETRIQRERMYQPDLFIADDVFYADFSDIKNIKYYQSGIDTLIMGNSPGYVLQNFGMGSALNVMTTLVFNAKSIDFYLPDDDIGLFHLDRNFLSGDDTLVYPNDSIYYHPFHYCYDSNVNYVLPLNQSSEKVYRSFGDGFCDDVIMAYLCAVMYSKHKGPIDIPVGIDLSYRDINGKHYKKRLALIIICSIEDENMVKCVVHTGLREKELSKETDKGFEPIDLDEFL